ncbi:Protein ANTAGONIST OF LIKE HETEROCHROMATIN PROTEIN 1 [Frankliniella fusca]|uniref:Protein ANTAGONIST OF LIKE HETEROCHROMATIN PROTEIN 1 n=1 Tax=Frankliniella fusca TaxID=407009 RepID=A0AAE1I1C8_9NEOP|nr:Protein ANTAGONIST OF LIKE HETEROCHROMATIN PROTEIN 1 [Frankliniella fusca]
MSSRRVLHIIKCFALLCLRREIEGDPLPAELQRSIQRLSTFNLLRRERLRIRNLVRVLKKKERRWWIRPVFLDRKLAGAWHSLIPVMREFDQDAHFNFLRMTPASFDWLLDKVSPFLTKCSIRRETISAGERLAVTLRYLASGDSQVSISYLFRISDSAVSNIVLETTAVIWFVLKDEVFEPLSKEFWRKKASEFEALWNFPMCVGAMDGKHCFVQKFPMRGSECYNYKFGHSLILFAVCDAKYKFIVVDAGARGRESDGGVFERSDFGRLFNSHQLQLPSSVYNSTLKSSLPYVFTGDNAFPLDVHLMTPYDDSLKPEEIVFNYRLSRARRVVENAFGILAARFRIFRSNIIGSETLVQNIILATTALHNYHLIREDSIPPKQRVYLPAGFADVYKSNGKLKKGRWRNEDKTSERSIFKTLVNQEIPNPDDSTASAVRNKFMELFILDPLPWQYDELPDIF